MRWIRGAIRVWLGCLAFVPTCSAQTSGVPAISEFAVGERAKFHLHRSLGPENLAFGALGAGIQTWRQRPDGWGQDAEGFGQRYGMRIGRSVISNGVAFGVGAALGEDPRYRPSGLHGFGPRMKYALTRSWVHHDRNGKMMPAYSRYAGTVAANVLTREYFPPGDDRWRDVARRTGFQYGWHIGWTILREFAPDLRKKLGR